MTGIVIRLVLAVLCLGSGTRLLMTAKAQRSIWQTREDGITRAEAWWSSTHGGPFDQERGAVPDDVTPYLGAKGPRTDLRSAKPAQAQWVWGWILAVTAAFLLVSVLAQLSS